MLWFRFCLADLQMFKAALSRTHGWPHITRPHTGVPEIGRAMYAQPCRKHGGARPVVSSQDMFETTVSELLSAQAMQRMPTARFLVPQYEGGWHTLHRQYITKTRVKIEAHVQR